MELKPIFLPSEDINQTNYYWFNAGFTSAEIDKIVEDAKEYPFVKALVVDEDNTDKFRKSNIKWLPFDSKWEWVIDRIMTHVIEANNMIGIWILDLVKFRIEKYLLLSNYLTLKNMLAEIWKLWLEVTTLKFQEEKVML
jgi:hypothetical protein